MATRKRTTVPQMRGVTAFLTNPVSQPVDSTSSLSLPIESIRLPAKQPRRYLDPEKLQQLADSIQQHGILEPLLVRPLPDGVYELVAGERRYKAAHKAGLKEVPVTVREISEQDAWQLALIENLQREDLNPVEETEGVLELLTLKLDCDSAAILDIFTQMATSRKKGIEPSGNVSRQLEMIAKILETTIGITPESFRTSRLPLLNLPVDILDMIRQGNLEYTKARAIARVKDEEDRQTLLEETVEQNLSLTQIKEKIKNLAEPQAKELTVSDRLVLVSRKLKASSLQEDTKKQKRLEKLLQELESLVEEDV